MSSLPAFRELVALGPAWGRALLGVAGRLEVSADELAATIYLESRGDPKARGPGGRVGLLQWSETTAANVGTSTAGLLEASALEQLVFVERQIRPYRARIQRPGDVRVAVFYPRALSWPDEAPLPEGVRAANAGMDRDADRVLTVGEVRAQAVRALAGRARWVLSGEEGAATDAAPLVFVAAVAVLLVMR